MTYMRFMFSCLVITLFFLSPLLFAETTSADEQIEFQKYKRFLEMKNASLGPTENGLEGAKGVGGPVVVEKERVNYLAWDLGLTLASLTGAPLNNMGSMIGVSAEGFACFKISDRFFWSPGIELVAKGANYGGAIVNLDYLQVPVELKYRVIEGDKTLDIGVGGYYGIAITRKITLDTGYGEETAYLSNVFSNADTGYKISVGTVWESIYFCKLEYSASLTSVWNGEDVKNSVFSIKGGRVFSF